MDNKISIGRLTAMLAIATGKQKRLCEDFIKELFQIVSSELENGESIRIKGFGTFRLVGVETRKSVNVATGEENQIPSYKKVVFTPSKELAAAVNKPFEDFVAVEISDELSTEELLADEVDNIYDIVEVGENVNQEENGVVKEEEPMAEEVPEEEEAPEEDVPEEEVVGSEEEALVEEATAEAYSIEPETETYEFEEESSRSNGRGRFIWGALFGFVLACVLGAGVFIIWGDALFGRLSTQPVENNGIVKSEIAVDPEPETADTVAAVPIEPIVVDTVTDTRYLTTMARTHYGNFNLWPLIYEENEKILGHPDRIRPGTEVVVPPLSKFNIDPQNPQDVAKIKEKGVEIYSRYKK